MKSEFFLLIVLIISLMNANRLLTQDCIILEFPLDTNKYFNNPDSVKIDTCSESITFGKKFVKYGINILTTDYIFQIIPLVLDSIYTTNDIDSINYPETYSGFKNFESIYGNIKFKRIFPIDSTHILHPEFIIELEDYELLDSVISKLSNIVKIWHADIRYYPVEYILFNLPQTDVGIIPRKSINDIEERLFYHTVWGPNINTFESDEIFGRNFHKLGYQWNLYSMKLPMAWEITTGDNNFVQNPVTIAVGENYTTDPSRWLYHKEFFGPNHLLNKNFICTYYTKLFGDNDINTANTRWTNMPFIAQDNDSYGLHDLLVLSTAIAPFDNNPMVGTAPNVRGAIINTWRAYLYDVDQQVNHIKVMPNIISMSTSNDYPPRIDAIDYGIVHIAAGGNQMELPYFGTRQPIIENGQSLYELQPRSLHEGNLEDDGMIFVRDTIRDPDGIQDVKPIIVGGVSNGGWHTCTENLIHNQWPSEYFINGNWNVTNQRIQYEDEIFIFNYRFSRDYVKFPRRPEDLYNWQWRDLRILRRAEARFDVCAPASGIMAAIDGILEPGHENCDVNQVDLSNEQSMRDFAECHCGPEPTSPPLTIQDRNNQLPNWVRCVGRVGCYFVKYTVASGGTSSAAPQVAGIVGLMLSVNNFMNVPHKVQSNGILMPDTDPVNGIEPADVHRRVYDILTFTAKKIPDYEMWTGPFQDGGRYSSSFTYHNDLDVAYNRANRDRNEKYKYNYVVQNNALSYDRLRRSWAQRVGFGYVDAYRAVAHSIANKGLYEYHETNTLDFSPSGNGNETPDGKKLLHLGSWVKLGHGLFELDADMEIAPGFINCPECTVFPNGTILHVLNYSGGYFIPGPNRGYGGVSLPGEFHNNQGVTKINSINATPPIPVTLTVPDNCILAIDGILTTDQSGVGHKIKSAAVMPPSTSTGKILMEGYLRDVTLEGFMKLSDMRVHCFGVSTSGIHVINNTSNSISEAYGVIDLNENSFLTVSSGTLTMRPGAEINTRSTSDVVIESGEIAMESATQITRNIGQKIVVQNGGILRVKENAKVDILTMVKVETGGQFIS